MSTSGESDQLACHPQACALQTCLQKHTYAPDKCEALVDKLWRCCGLYYRTRGVPLDGSHPDPDALLAPGSDTPDACPLPSVTRRKLLQRSIPLD